MAVQFKSVRHPGKIFENKEPPIKAMVEVLEHYSSHISLICVCVAMRGNHLYKVQLEKITQP